MFTPLDAILLGLLQGITELFPISSLGHSVILPRLLHWSINQQANSFLVFIVATHFATSLVLFLFFYKDWQQIIAGMIRSLRTREIKNTDPYAKLAWLLVIATIPAGFLGLLFEEKLKTLFASPQLAAFVLILNGLMLLAAESLRKQRTLSNSGDPDTRIAKLNWTQALAVGSVQCLALIPGFSRTGSTIAGSLLVGLSHEDSARFSFLLAAPIIAAASLLKLPDLLTPEMSSYLGVIIIGAIAAAIGAYISVAYLTKYFKTKTLTPFAIYCLLVGSLASFIFLFS